MTRYWAIVSCGAIFSFIPVSPNDVVMAAKPLAIPYQLTHARNLDPSPSPDGKKLVLIVVVSGKEQLFTMDVDGSNPLQITHDDADHEDPAWSPDGKKIAFVSIKGDRRIIHIMNPDGTGMEALTPPEVRTIHPSWSVDSRHIIYCTDDDVNPPDKNASEIQNIDVKTKQIAKLISEGTNTYPDWSPDMKKIVFRKILGEMNSEVFVADSDGSNLRNLTNHWAFDGWPEWSPDGKRIAFASNRAASYQIYIMNADGSDVRLVANTEGRATVPRWSPDGKTIYFTICKKVDYGADCEIFVAHL
jgi:TolB protein